jgi:hypothetical protein
MSEESITLEARSHGKVGLIHCGVTRDGFIAVGGDPRDIADGEEILFERVGIKAKRSGSEYTFTKVS